MHSSVYRSHEGGSSVPSPAAARETSENATCNRSTQKDGIGRWSGHNSWYRAESPWFSRSSSTLRGHGKFRTWKSASGTTFEMRNLEATIEFGAKGSSVPISWEHVACSSQPTEWLDFLCWYLWTEPQTGDKGKWHRRVSISEDRLRVHGVGPDRWGPASRSGLSAKVRMLEKIFLSLCPLSVLGQVLLISLSYFSSLWTVTPLWHAVQDSWPSCILVLFFLLLLLHFWFDEALKPCNVFLGLSSLVYPWFCTSSLGIFHFCWVHPDLPALCPFSGKKITSLQSDS